MKRSLFRRLTGLMLGLTYFAVNGAFVYSLETAFWAQRRQASRAKRTPSSLLASFPTATPAMGVPDVDINLTRGLASSHIPRSIAKTLPGPFVQDHARLLAALSSSDGTIRQIKTPAQGVSGKIILHVQDVHLNTDAQKSLSRLMTSVSQRDAVDVVGLEGAFGPLDFSRYRAYPRRDIVREVARVLLSQGDISGPIHAALSQDPTPPVTVGIDDPIHYRANVEAYRAAAPLQKKVAHQIEEEGRRLALEKKRVYSPALQRFDDQWAAYQDGRLPLGDYIQVLREGQPHSFQTLDDFTAARTLEKSVDFALAEQQRFAFVEALVSALDKQTLTSLSALAASCRAGSLGYGDFYSQLESTGQKAGVSLKTYPAFSMYVHYVLAADRIFPDRLFTDLRSAEKAVYARLARTDAEKRLVEDTRRARLRKKLSEFSLTPEEWSEWALLPREDMAPFEAFYREAQIRDQSMTEKFLAAMENRQAKTGLLVTGGFHGPGMEERFLRAGATVISFTPRIDKIDTAQGPAYLNVFLREKTPLDRMFAGRTLFLTPPVFAPPTSEAIGPLLAAALEAAQSARGNPNQRVTTTFRSLSSMPGAEKARLTVTQLPNDQMGVRVEVNGETTTLWVKMNPEGNRVLAYDTVRPGDERTTERAQRLFRKWFNREASAQWIHAFAGMVEWNFLSPRFVVQHHPQTPAKWVHQIQNRRWLIFGSGIILVATALLAVALSTGAFSGSALVKTATALAVALPFAYFAMMLWHFVLAEVRFARGETPPAKRARSPPFADALVSVVQDLAHQGLVPSVNERPLNDLVGQPRDLLNHIRRHGVVRSPSAVLGILSDRLLLETHPQTNQERKNEILNLYDGLFNQDAYLSRHPLKVVLFRGGRAASSLTKLLSKIENIRITAVVAGSDSGRSHHVAATYFGTPGVPDMGKALLDLAQSEPMKEFLESRFQIENGEVNDETEINYMRDFEGLTEYLVNQKTNRSSENLDPWLRKVDGLPDEDKRALGIYFSSFLRIMKTVHSNQVIGDPTRNRALPPFRFNNYPLRSIALQGAVWLHLGEGWPDPWQRAMNGMAKILKLREGDSVRIATSNPQHLVALTTDGTIFFGETGLNEFPRTTDIIPLWMVDHIPALEKEGAEGQTTETQKKDRPRTPKSLDELLKEFNEKTGLTLEPPTLDELKEQGIDASVHDELIATVRRLPVGQRSPENVEKMIRFFRFLSRSARDAANPVVVHHQTAQAIREAHVVVYGAGTQESNIISSMLPRGIREALFDAVGAVKIYFVNPTKENKRMFSNGATLLQTFYRHLSGQGEKLAGVDWRGAAAFVDYAVGRSDEFPGLDPNKVYNSLTENMIHEETRGQVVAVPLNLESQEPRLRESGDYKKKVEEFGFFHDPLTRESIIALRALKAAGRQLTKDGDIVRRKTVARPVQNKELLVRHMNMVRRRMESAGIEKQVQDALLAEMNDFTVKSQQWYYTRLMRILGLPVQQWLLECQNAEWTEMTSRMVELLNSVTEVISLDYDDTLEPRNTNLSNAKARLLALRIASGQKITFITAKTLEELATVTNAGTGEKGVEIYAPLREALVEIMELERINPPEDWAQNRADDLLHDLFFMYMNSGGALVRPTVRGCLRAADLPLDPYFTVKYPPELEAKIDRLLKENPSSGIFSFPLAMVVQFYNLMKMIIRPFGEKATPKSERAVIAERINSLFEQYGIPARVNPAGKTSIDVNQLLLGGEALEKSRAIQHLFNQGHRRVTFIDNEITEGNAVSVLEKVKEMAADPYAQEGRTLRVIAVDRDITEQKLRDLLGLAPILVHKFPDYSLTHSEMYRPFSTSDIVLLNGLTETEAVEAFLRNAPYGNKGARGRIPSGERLMFEAVLTLRPQGFVSRLYLLTLEGRRKRWREIRMRNPKQPLIDELTTALLYLRGSAYTLEGSLQSIVVKILPGFNLPDAANFSSQLEERLGGLPVYFEFLPMRQSGSRPFSVVEQKAKAYLFGGLALSATAETLVYLAFGMGSFWVLPVAFLSVAFFFRYSWKAVLARNEQRRLMAQASQWDPNDASQSVADLFFLRRAFQRVGIASRVVDMTSFEVSIGGQRGVVRLPANQNELSSVLNRGRLAETRRGNNSFEIVISPGIDPALLPSVVLTEIHRVSPVQSIVASLRQVQKLWDHIFPFKSWHQSRLARRDQKTSGAQIPEKTSRSARDFLFSPVQSFNIDGINGRSSLYAQIAERAIASPSYAREWNGNVDTLVSFHQVLEEDLPALRALINHSSWETMGRLQFVLVPGANDIKLIEELNRMASDRVTVFQHRFNTAGELEIDRGHFEQWAEGKGSIAWLATRNPRAVPLSPTEDLPALNRLLDILRSAPPLTKANLSAIRDLALAILHSA
ncbi:MAG: YvcK family protein [Elusimicrobia bacterium]|nr:YvcK family protein [Elusimicrobiota bacterium]